VHTHQRYPTHRLFNPRSARLARRDLSGSEAMESACMHRAACAGALFASAQLANTGVLPSLA